MTEQELKLLKILIDLCDNFYESIKDIKKILNTQKVQENIELKTLYIEDLNDINLISSHDFSKRLN